MRCLPIFTWFYEEKVSNDTGVIIDVIVAAAASTVDDTPDCECVLVQTQYSTGTTTYQFSQRANTRTSAAVLDKQALIKKKQVLLCLHLHIFHAPPSPSHLHLLSCRDPQLLSVPSICQKQRILSLFFFQFYAPIETPTCLLTTLVALLASSACSCVTIDHATTRSKLGR